MNLQEFKQQLESQAHPTIVDFWAPWCAPCRVTKPILESLAREYEGRVDLLMINADEHPQLLQELKVFGIPTVLVTRSGQIVKKFTGAQSRENYRAMFQALADGSETAAVSISTFDRNLRLFTGTAVALVGLNTSAWILVAIGGIIAFLGFYDRCPIWKAITSQFSRKRP
jgi:thioredoxin